MSKRWMDSVRKAATENEVRMPWARGARRQAMIARRAQAKASETPERLSA